MRRKPHIKRDRGRWIVCHSGLPHLDNDAWLWTIERNQFKGSFFPLWEWFDTTQGIDPRSYHGF